VQFTLPGGKWRRLVDTQQYFDTTAYLNQHQPPLPLRTSQNVTLDMPTALPSSDYGVAPRSIVVLEQF
jgi:hypothetical protein